MAKDFAYGFERDAIHWSATDFFRLQDYSARNDGWKPCIIVGRLVFRRQSAYMKDSTAT